MNSTIIYINIDYTFPTFSSTTTSYIGNATIIASTENYIEILDDMGNTPYVLSSSNTSIQANLSHIESQTTYYASQTTTIQIDSGDTLSFSEGYIIQSGITISSEGFKITGATGVFAPILSTGNIYVINPKTYTGDNVNAIYELQNGNPQ